MKKVLFYMAIVALVLSTSVAFADTLMGTDGWRAWSAANEDGTPFWDNHSSDGDYLNIGYYLTKTGGFSGYAPYEHPGNIDYYGTSGGLAPASFYFQNNHAPGAAMRLEIAGNAGTNEFGWYNSDVAWNPSTSPNPIFVGGDAAGAAKEFTPTSNYGFYLKVGDTYYKTVGQSEHFAVFQESPGYYWIGMEDLNLGDADYNDMVVKIAPVPEPMTMLLLGLGLTGVAGLRRFKK